MLFRSFFDAKGRITAKEYLRLFRTLYVSNYLEQGDSEYLLDLLNRSDFDLFLRASIPQYVAFPHKWGAFPLDHTYGDAGIVYVDNRPYMIGVLVQGRGALDETRQVEALMQSVSSLAYAYFEHAW